MRDTHAVRRGSTPDQFDAFVKSELAKWGAVIRSLNCESTDPGVEPAVCADPARNRRRTRLR